MCKPTTLSTTPTVVKAALPSVPTILTRMDATVEDPDDFGGGFPPGGRRTSGVSVPPSLAPIDEESESSFEEQDETLLEDPFSNIDMPAEFFCGFQSLPPLDTIIGGPITTCEDSNLKEESVSKQQQSKRRRVQVHFGTVSIRTYDVQVGFNNGIPLKAGVPLQLDWYYEQQPTLDLDEYEACRKPRRPSRKPRHFRLSPQERWDILIKAGFDTATLNQARKEAFQIRAQRKLSNAMLPAEMTFKRLAASVVV